MKNKAICIIPARGGSKRIPKKNIRDFLGKPIIAYSIETALKSNLFDEVMVSTDDEEIAKIARKYGAKVPFLRSKVNSDDNATTADVIEEVVLEYEKKEKKFNYFCSIYPTAPFVTANKLKKAMELLDKTQADAVVPVVRFSFPIQRAFKIDEGKLFMIWPEKMDTRSQDLEPTYHDCGQFYCLEIKSFLDQKKLFTTNTVPMEMPESEVQDIDNEEDWKIAEMKYKLVNNIF